MNIIIKQSFLGNAIGRALINARNAIDILLAAYKLPESIGTIANDQMASYLLTRLCDSGKTFVDVGSHIGSVIAEVMHNDSSINIIGIEAIPEKAERLRKKFKSVEIHSCAVGNETGEVPFFINTKKSGYSSLDKSNLHTEEITVPIKRLDDIVLHDNIDMIKIDVEGAELGVIMGAQQIIASNRPVIMFESGPNNSLGFTKKAMWKFLTELGYSIHIPNRVAHNDDGLDMHGFIDSHIYPRRTTNYFAIPLERRIEIRGKARELLNIKSEQTSIYDKKAT